MLEGELGRVYRNNEVIFSEGEKGEVMYVIQSGNVKITKDSATGNVILATLNSGDIFGEMSLFDKMPRSATATASGDARILSIDRKKLFTTISRDPTLVFKILETMSMRIRRLNDEMSKLKKAKADILKTYFNVEDTCSMILEEVRNIIKAENGSVMFLNEENSLKIGAAYGKKSEQKVMLSAGKGIAGDVLKTGRSELVNNVTMDSRYVQGKTQIRSMLCAPLKSNNHVFGVINLSNSSENLFTFDDLKVLNTLSIYASIALQNALSFANLKNIADQMLMHATIFSIV